MIEDDKELCRAIADYLREEHGFEVVGTAYDGKTGFELLLKTEPDVLLLDMVLPKWDGISVLKELKNSDMPNKPTCIILSSIGKESVTAEALDLGADYYILKPFDMLLLAERIAEVHLYKCENRKNLTQLMKSAHKTRTPEDFVIKLLHDLGMATNLKGYLYVKRAILLGVDDLMYIKSVTKILYPMIGKEFDTSAGNVERAIRNVIETSWRNGNAGNYAQIFESASLSDAKPSNSVFITLAVEHYNLQRR